MEKALLTTNVKLVRGTGLNKLLGDRAIETIGLETAFLDVNHIHKARYAVQLSVVAIYSCLKEAHLNSQSSEPLFSWAKACAKTNNMFKYWLLVLNFQIDYLLFVRSLREGNYALFVNVLSSLVIWFFIFDQIHYARWVSVHVQDLLTMPITCPVIHGQIFSQGHFAVQISNREFSKIHYDQAHEQANKVIKSIRGPISFVNRAKDDLQRRWEVAGPEIVEYLENVEKKLKPEKTEGIQPHHEDNPSMNSMYIKDSTLITGRLMAVNPFLEDSFVKLGTKKKFSEEVSQFVNVIPDIGKRTVRRIPFF